MTTKQTKIVWLSGYPAHYMRSFHCRLEQAYPSLINFVYIDDLNSSRSYEKGNLPDAKYFLNEHANWNVVTRILSKINPKIIIVSGHYPRPLLKAALWGFKNKIPVLYWSDTNLYDVLVKSNWQRCLRKLFFRWYFKRMHTLLHPGARTRDYYIWAAGRSTASKLIQMPYPAFVNQTVNLNQNVSRPISTFRILYLGRLSPEKGVDQLIKAFAIILSKKKSSNLRLIIAGDGPERLYLTQLATQLGLTAYVEFMGAVSSDHTEMVYKEASLFVLPSHIEPWGIVIAEALAAGIPVISPFWVGAVADLVINGVTGIVLRDNSPEEIARGMFEVLEKPEVIHRMGENGRKLLADGCWGINGALYGFNQVLERLDINK